MFIVEDIIIATLETEQRQTDRETDWHKDRHTQRASIVNLMHIQWMLITVQWIIDKDVKGLLAKEESSFTIYYIHDNYNMKFKFFI